MDELTGTHNPGSPVRCCPNRTGLPRVTPRAVVYKVPPGHSHALEVFKENDKEPELENQEEEA